METIALVDADSLLYKVGFAVEEKIILNEWECDWDDGVEPIVEYRTDLDTCYSNLDQMIDNMMYTTGCTSVKLVFSGEDNFRLTLPTPYKGNRDKSRKPTGFEEILNYALTTYEDSFVVQGFEADDYIVNAKTENPGKYVICAIDKDVLYQAAGVHYNYGREEFVDTSREHAIWYAYFQTLAGDPTDGYKGVPGVGEVRATKILADCETECELWEATVKAYEAKGLTIEDAILTMQLANMHQLHQGKIKLWQPPTTSNDRTL